MRGRTVLILISGNLTLTDVSGPSDVFGIASQYFLPPGAVPYQIIMASAGGGLVATSSGIVIQTTALADVMPDAVDTILVPGAGPPTDPPIPPELVAWLASHGGAPRRLCAVCTGAFLLAAAGLLDGVKVTTHWQSAQALAERFPEVKVDAQPVFIRDGRVWSSAGMTACLDLALAIVEDDLGHEVAMEVARSMVLFLRRPGEQPQVSAPLSLQAAGDPKFMRLHAWMLQNLAGNLTLEVLADRAGMSLRTFTRHYTRKVGRSPAKTIEGFRLEAAQRILLESEAPLKKVARECGFGDEQNLRRAFLRATGILPEQFRQGARLSSETETVDWRSNA